MRSPRLIIASIAACLGMLFATAPPATAHVTLVWSSAAGCGFDAYAAGIGGDTGFGGVNLNPAKYAWLARNTGCDNPNHYLIFTVRFSKSGQPDQDSWPGVLYNAGDYDQTTACLALLGNIPTCPSAPAQYGGGTLKVIMARCTKVPGGALFQQCTFPWVGASHTADYSV